MERHLLKSITILAFAVSLGACGRDHGTEPAPRADGDVPEPAWTVAPLTQARVPMPASKRETRATGERWLGLTASRWRAGEVAVWNGHQVVIRSLTHKPRRLTLPGDRSRGRVVGATFDRRGGLHLLFENKTLLSWVGRGPSPRTRTLRFATDTILLTSTRRHLVWLGQSERSFQPPRVRASSDSGRAWWKVKAPTAGNAGLELFVGLDGQLQMMTASEAACGGGAQHRELGRLGAGTRDWRNVPWPLDTPYSWMLGPRGWAYAHVSSGDDACGVFPAGQSDWLCSVRSRKARPVRLMRGDPVQLSRALKDWWPDGGPMANNGRQAVLTVGDLVLMIEGRRALALPTPARLTALALDRAGTIYALAGARLLTWSERSRTWTPR